MADAAPFRTLDTEAQLEDLYEQSRQQPVVLFKHSSACPISARANEELQALTKEDDPPVYRLVVQQAQALSDKVAEALKVQHETPQAIVLSGAEAVFHDSHQRVTAEAVREAAYANNPRS